MRSAFAKLAPIAFLGVLPIALFVSAVLASHHKGNAGLDFRSELYPEAKLVLHGSNPFPAPDADLSSGLNNIFPIPAALLAAPFTVLPATTAAAVVCIVLLGLLGLTLWVLEVRDWQVYGLVVLWPGTIAAVQTGNLSIVLALLTALAWRTRDRRFLPGLLVWLVALRRFGAAGLGAALGLLGGVVLVAPFGEGIGDYVRLLNNLGRTFGRESYNLIGLLLQAHAVSYGAAVVIADLAGAVILVVAYVRRSLTLALLASLALSPIVWLHYFVLLVVPLAIAWPKLAPAWFVPLLLWLCPGTLERVHLWHIAVALPVVVATAVLAEAARRSSRLSRSGPGGRRQPSGRGTGPWSRVGARRT
jgi:hypothetical protein